MHETFRSLVNNFQLTTVPGVYAAGDNSSMMRALSAAIATGGIAGAMLNKEHTDILFGIILIQVIGSSDSRNKMHTTLPTLLPPL